MKYVIDEIDITITDGSSLDTDTWAMQGDSDAIDDGEVVMLETEHEYVFRDKKTDLVLGRYFKKNVVKIRYSYEEV